MRGLISMTAFIKKCGLGARGGISLERVDGFLRVSEQHGSWCKGFQQRFAHGGIRIFVQNRLQSLIGFCVPSQRTLRLCRPVQRIFPEQRVVLRLDKPADSLPRFILHVVVVTKRKRGARSPDVRGVLDGEGRKLFVRSGRPVVESTSDFGEFFLRRLVFRCISRNLRRGSLRLASGPARRRLWLLRFALVL